MPSLRAAVSNLLGTSDHFVEDNFSMDLGRWVFEMIQVCCIYCALYFYYYCISSTSDDQALVPRGWGPLPWALLEKRK